MDSLLPQFPHPDTADETGCVAITRDITPELLLAAYRQGIFPWTDAPVRWFSPDPRAIFLWDRVTLPSNLRKIARRQRFVVTFDQAFTEVMRGCAESHADDGVWITPRFLRAYAALHAQGHAHSVEVWQDGQLVGGLYGVQTRGLFAGESMFYRVSSASKVAFLHLIERLQAMNILLLDAQVLNEHTEQLGAVQVHRRDYLALLAQAMRQPSPFDGLGWPSAAAPRPV